MKIKRLLKHNLMREAMTFALILAYATAWAETETISSENFSVNADGTEYTIHAAEGWNSFCNALQNNDTYNHAAPFRNVENGGVIENLIVEGVIATSAKNAAGIAGNQFGTVRIRNCRSSVTIQSSVNGDGNLIVNGEGTLQVFDVLGYEILCTNLSPFTSHLSPLISPGVYVLHLINGKGVKTQKMVYFCQ